MLPALLLAQSARYVDTHSAAYRLGYITGRVMLILTIIWIVTRFLSRK